jgi:hypothetical protein
LCTPFPALSLELVRSHIAWGGCDVVQQQDLL